MPSTTSFGTPSGFLSDFMKVGGIALMSTAFDTRPLPCRATYRVTSPPPVECPICTVFLRSSAWTTWQHLRRTYPCRARSLSASSGHGRGDHERSPCSRGQGRTSFVHPNRRRIVAIRGERTVAAPCPSPCRKYE